MGFYEVNYASGGPGNIQFFWPGCITVIKPGCVALLYLYIIAQHISAGLLFYVIPCSAGKLSRILYNG